MTLFRGGRVHTASDPDATALAVTDRDNQVGRTSTSFTMAPGTGTAWQHDAREQPDGTITLFDNGATPAVHAQSRAIQVRLDPLRRTATLVREAHHPGKALVEPEVVM